MSNKNEKKPTYLIPFGIHLCARVKDKPQAQGNFRQPTCCHIYFYSTKTAEKTDLPTRRSNRVLVIVSRMLVFDGDDTLTCSEIRQRMKCEVR